MLKINAKIRDVKSTDKEKGPFQLRKQGLILGVIFGKEVESIPIQILATDFFNSGDHEPIVELMVGRKKYSTKIQSVQKDPMTGEIVHISFLKI